jgi:hypothetical protein
MHKEDSIIYYNNYIFVYMIQLLTPPIIRTTLFYNLKILLLSLSPSHNKISYDVSQT